MDGFFREEEFGRGRELVEGLRRDVQVRVGVIETAVRVGFVVRSTGSVMSHFFFFLVSI